MEIRKFRNNHRLRVIHARPEDAKFICEVAQAANVRHMASMNKGFLLFPWEEDAYRKLASLQLGLCLCLYNENPAGFICSFPVNSFHEIPLEMHSSLERQIIDAILKISAHYSEQSCQVVYQMALRPDLQSKSLGGPFFKHFVKLVQGPYYGVILEEPINSIRRIFWCALGFSKVGSVELPTPADLEFLHNNNEHPRTLIWGIYRAENPDRNNLN